MNRTKDELIKLITTKKGHVNGYKYQLITQTWFIGNYNLIDFENNEWLFKRMEQFKPKEI